MNETEHATPTPDAQAANPPTHYVGIGASAGGLEALEEFLKPMPKNTGMTFIIVQHLSPDYKSMMVELLSRKTTMEVLQIQDGMPAEANRVYLIPPKKNLEMYHAQLFLTEQQRDTGLYLPIDIFFRSLAIDQRKKAIGVILSGTGSDGTLGVRAIKEQGGLVMVQDHSTAKFDGMPKSAIATGVADYILNAAHMSDALVKYVKHPLVVNDGDEPDHNKEETDFMKILSLIRTHVGEDFSYYKPKTIIRRIERRISVNQIQNTEDYVELLLHSKQECEILAKEFLIGVTQFFRDTEAYAALEERVIPQLFARDDARERPIRIWSAACSTGEEAYSVAILCKEYMEQHGLDVDLKIFATDLDKEAVKYAGMASYSESIVSDVSPQRLRRYFIKRHDSYQVSEDLRQMVIFSNHNVLTDPPFSKIDLIICRNLLIYFKPEMQQKVLGLFQYSLADGGYLFLGSSESLSGVSDAFETVHSKWKLFRYKQGGIAPPMLANLLNVRTHLSSPNRPLAKPAVPPHEHKPEHVALYEQVVNVFAPAGVIVDEENTVVHFFHNVQPYLKFPSGKASYNLLELADPQLTMILSNMLYKVRKEQAEVSFNKVRFSTPETDMFLNLSAYPLRVKKGGQRDFIVIAIREYQSAESKAAVDEEPETRFDYDEQASERIRELERELQYRDENLQTTIEELETSNEELQATNEELVSSNEELQSTNEELQSVNEELYTVNSQYQEKIKELTTLNNDVNNLLANTQIGTLFLDSHLTVRKFTPEITKLINVMDIDVGRPFSHLTLNCECGELRQNVSEVLDTLVPKELELHADDGEWYLLKIQPYRHADRSIHGILLTQVRITALKEATLASLRSQEKYQTLFETMTQGVVYQDADGEIIAANPAAERILGLSLDQMLGRTSIDPRWKAITENGENFPGDRHPAIVALKTGKPVSNVVMGVFNPAYERTTWIRVNAVPLIRPGEETPYQVYAMFDDITEQKLAEKRLHSKTLEAQQQRQALERAGIEVDRVGDALAQTEEQLELSRKEYAMLLNTLTVAVAYHKIITDDDGAPVDYEFLAVNDAFEHLTGLSRRQVIGNTVKQVMPDIEAFWITTFGRVALDGEPCELEHEAAELGKQFRVKAYSLEPGYFVAVFDEASPSS